MKLTHWFIDTMIYWIFQFLLLKRSRTSQTVLVTKWRYLTKIVPRRCAPRITLVYFWDSNGQKIPYLSINDHHWNPQKSTKCYLYRYLCRFELSESYDIDTWPLITWLLKYPELQTCYYLTLYLAGVPSIFDECAFRGTVVCGTARTGIHLDFGYSSKWFYFRILNYFIILTSSAQIQFSQYRIVLAVTWLVCPRPVSSVG